MHNLIGATIRANNRTFGLAPPRPWGDPEIVTEIVDAYCLTIATDAGNCYSNGDFTVVRLREGVSDY